MKRHALRRWGVVCFVVTSAVLLFPSCLWWCAQGTEFVVSVADWLPQDYVDSRGVTSVVHEKGQLIVTADVDGQDAERGSGEIVLDLH